MLFSREEVAAYIQQNFEPAWEMVREVPIIRIDFGNGRVATRTLHGNVASYVCAADGQVCDILPGIYTPPAYTAALEQPRVLAGRLRQLQAAQRLTSLRSYHRDKAQILQAARLAIPPQRAQPNPLPPRADVGKGRIELRMEQVVQAQQLQQAVQAQAAAPRPRTASELAAWAPLTADTLRNESERRLLIHERFAGADSVRPEQIKRWLYRDVLHADLDDPYLGLGDDFFADLER